MAWNRKGTGIWRKITGRWAENHHSGKESYRSIHEYAHHIHDTEFNCRERRDAPHGKQFWQIYGQLMCRARSLGIIQDTLVQDPVLVFLTDTPPTAAAGAPSRKSDIDLDGELPPSLRHALRELLKCVYDWLNRN